MKFTNICLVAFGALSMSSAFASDSLSDAIKNGKMSGDVTIFYESRNIKSNPNMKPSPGLQHYFQDSAYNLTSVYLGYETGKFYNFSAKVGLRAYDVWEKEKGASSPWVDNSRSSGVQDAYIAYDDGNLQFKIGRQKLYTELFAYFNADAITANYSPIENLNFDFVYNARKVSVTDRKIKTTVDFGDDTSDGFYKLGASYKFDNGLYTKVYYGDSPDGDKIYAGKLTYDTSSEDIKYGGYSNYMHVKSDGLENANLYDVQAYVKVLGIKYALGYTKNDNGALYRASYVDGAWYGDTIVQFEEGDGMYSSGDNDIYYALINTKLVGVDLTLLYGETDYDYGSGAKYSKDELNIFAKYKINKDLRFSLVYAFVNEDENDARVGGDTTQVNAKLVYKF